MTNFERAKAIAQSGKVEGWEVKPIHGWVDYQIICCGHLFWYPENPDFDDRMIIATQRAINALAHKRGSWLEVVHPRPVESMKPARGGVKVRSTFYLKQCKENYIYDVEGKFVAVNPDELTAALMCLEQLVEEDNA